MAIQLNAENYQRMVDSIRDLFTAGGISAVIISIYQDAEATTPMLDSDGCAIVGLPVCKTVLKPTVQSSAGTTVPGNITISFNGCSDFVTLDIDSSAWYVLAGKPY